MNLLIKIYLTKNSCYWNVMLLIELPPDDHVIISDGYQFETAVGYSCTALSFFRFLFLSRAITLGGYPLGEDLGGYLSGTQLKPGSARDPSPTM